jgi:hypothetical protein
VICGVIAAICGFSFPFGLRTVKERRRGDVSDRARADASKVCLIARSVNDNPEM